MTPFSTLKSLDKNIHKHLKTTKFLTAEAKGEKKKCSCKIADDIVNFS